MKKWSSPTDDGTYSSWRAMHARCAGRGNHAAYYAGVTVCPEWASFDEFYKDMGARPLGMTLDRKDVTKGYDRNNCRWATRSEQSQNTHRAIKVTFRGETKTLSQWATALKVPYYLLWNRHKAGWPVDKLLHPSSTVLPVRHGSHATYAKGCRCTECCVHRSEYYRRKKYGETT